MATIIVNAFWLGICIYYEAGNQAMDGKIAVAHVVMNRVHNRGMSVEDVIKQPKQFSFYNIDLRKSIPFVELGVLEECFEAAYKCLEERLNGKNLNGANYYFNPSLVHPKWADGMKLVAEIEDHVFYRG